MEWKGTMYDFSNPRKTGPGVWFMFHLSAAQSSTREERLIVCKQIKNFCVYFKCSDCQSHCKRYVKAHPPEDSIETSETLFKWTVDFRNAVQRRLGGPIYDYDTMVSIFYDSAYMVCDEDCTGNEQQGKSKHRDYIYFSVDGSQGAISKKSQASVHELFGVPLMKNIRPRGGYRS